MSKNIIVITTSFILHLLNAYDSFYVADDFLTYINRYSADSQNSDCLLIFKKYFIYHITITSSAEQSSVPYTFTSSYSCSL